MFDDARSLLINSGTPFPEVSDDRQTGRMPASGLRCWTRLGTVLIGRDFKARTSVRYRVCFTPLRLLADMEDWRDERFAKPVRGNDRGKTEGGETNPQ